jgi:RHS repeat-associated protein
MISILHKTGLIKRKVNLQGDTTDFTWQYDAAGNRLSSNESLLPSQSTATTYSPNSLNQYSSVNSQAWSYDSDGNLLSDGTRTMTWDVKNRLAQVVIGGKTVSYVYDHNDWRVKKTVNGVETDYLYDGTLLLAETDASGKIQKIYINDGARIIGMVKYVYKPDGTFSHYMPMYYMFDSLGSVSAITAETGKPIQMYKYTPYGRVTNTIDDSENALRFIGAYGGYQDDDTGLTYFWHRWYDAQNGRWVKKDPINVYGGINLFSYVKNRSINYTDIEGLAFDSNCCSDKLRKCNDIIQEETIIYSIDITLVNVNCSMYCDTIIAIPGAILLPAAWVAYVACEEGCHMATENLWEAESLWLDNAYKKCQNNYNKCMCDQQ